MPVEPAVLAAFMVAAAALIVSPGPDTILILRYTLTSGQRVGLATVLGVQLGLAAHTLAAALGLSVIIASVPAAFKGIAAVGALYLAWLGIQSFRAGGLKLGLSESGPSIGAHKAWRDAMFTNILNPKVILMFLALMPNFVDLDRRAGPQLMVLGGALIAVNAVWQTGLALAAGRARNWLGSAAVQRVISRATGAILLFFAAAMLATNLF